MSFFREIFNEFNSTIKSRDTEERLDLVFYRPFGFIIAKIAFVLKMNPSQLSILGLISAIIAAFMYATEMNSISVLLIASGLFLLSGIFDSSDGQLARLSNSGSKMGLVIDGLCDAGATIAIYTGVFWPLFIENPLWIIVVFLAALSHSYQCAILDFYHREYLYFGYGITDRDYWNPTVSEMDSQIMATKGFEQFTNKMRKNWVKQQSKLSVRNDNTRLKMKDLINSSDDKIKSNLQLNYKKFNLPMLTYWRLIGTNAHTIVIILLVLLNKRELVLIFDLFIFNFIIFLGRFIQRNRDQLLFKEVQLT